MILWQEDTAKNNVSSSPPAWEESCVGERVMKKLCHSRTTKIIKSCNYKTKQLHCMTTPNQTITLYDNTKPNNSIVWQHQTKQFHCLTTPNQTNTLYDNTKPNNSIVWQHVRTWYYDKMILPKIMCPHQVKKVVLKRGWWKSCVGERVMKKLCHSRTTKIIQVVTIKPNKYIVWQHQTK